MFRQKRLSDILSAFTVTIFVMVSVSAAYGLQCSEVLSRGQKSLEIREAKMDLNSSVKSFVVRDLNNPDVEFSGHLSSTTGRLDVSARLSFPEDGYRSSLSGADLYRQMMSHFGSDNVVSIAGTWVDGINLEAYNRNIEEGMDENSAALSTWSGRQASKYGFTKVEYVDESYNLFTEEVSVHVVFIRAD